MKRSFILLLAVLLAACGAGTPAELPPETIVGSSAEVMRDLDGFSFRLARTGAPVFVDPIGIISFREAEGSFVSPNKVQATVKVIAPGIVAEVSIIGIDQLEWETNIFSGEWQLVSPEYAFQPAVLFNPDGGIQNAIEQYLLDPVLLGIVELEEIPGQSLYHLGAQMDGANVHALTFGLIDEQLLDVELWIAPDSFELYRLQIIDPIDEGATESTIWQLDFWDFGRVIEIAPPI